MRGGSASTVRLYFPSKEGWPEIEPHVEKRSGLWFAQTPRWGDPADLAEIVGPPPERLVQPVSGVSPFEPVDRRYPESWPLPGPTEPA